MTEGMTGKAKAFTQRGLIACLAITVCLFLAWTVTAQEPENKAWKPDSSYLEFFSNDNDEFRLLASRRHVAVMVKDKAVSLKDTNLIQNFSTLLDVPTTLAELDSIFITESTKSSIKAEYGIETDQGELVVQYNRKQKKTHAFVILRPTNGKEVKAEIKPADGVNAAALLRFALMFHLTVKGQPEVDLFKSKEKLGKKP